MWADPSSWNKLQKALKLCTAGSQNGFKIERELKRLVD